MTAIVRGDWTLACLLQQPKNETEILVFEKCCPLVMMRLGHMLMTTSDITEQTHDPSELVDWEYKLQEEHAHTHVDA